MDQRPGGCPEVGKIDGTALRGRQVVGEAAVQEAWLGRRRFKRKVRLIYKATISPRHSSACIPSLRYIGDSSGRETRARCYKRPASKILSNRNGSLCLPNVQIPLLYHPSTPSNGVEKAG